MNTFPAPHWALRPDCLSALQEFCERAQAAGFGDGNTEAFQGIARRARETAARQDGAAARTGVAVIPIMGVLAPRSTWLLQLLGGTPLDETRATVEEAAAEKLAIVLHVDSPGGQVAGVQALADRVRQLRDAGHSVTAVIDGVGCSAGYWIASAASRVYIADRTTVVGSVGVVATHVDLSGREAARGIKTTEISAGKYKRIASAYAPLNEDGRDSLQAQVDAIYSVFVEAVATNRGVSVDAVLSRMADGREFVGDHAVRAGLVDGVATLAEVLAPAKARPRQASAASVAQRARPPGANAALESIGLFKELLLHAHGYGYLALSDDDKSFALGYLAEASSLFDPAADRLDSAARQQVVIAAMRAAKALERRGVIPAFLWRNASDVVKSAWCPARQEASTGEKLT